MAKSALWSGACGQQLIEVIVLSGSRHTQPDVVQVCVGRRLLTTKNNHLSARWIKNRSVRVTRCRTSQGPHLGARERAGTQENEEEKEGAELLHDFPIASIKQKT
jgi:hypothetical protein